MVSKTFFSATWIAIKFNYCSGKVSVERRRVRLWNESEWWVMIMFMLSGGMSLDEKGVGGGERVCDYSAVSSVDNFLILECHIGRGILRRGTCENTGWMKDLYRYRKGAIPLKGIRR